ncbi:Regulator of sigma-E protease RseP [Pseudoruegeria aquimaris]|uniref:Zinc metalloprotease n=1 Tax=Pseudoruegeria aquimaris TaxID=393663 RepID=A0A1Y5S811_9RHOB|nr:RIP metalloprotease RseP [Pseudoruegeria aquimaris]SLN34564.1 Regulator of sigma-E protease RseP [Pseudoruegeria aquimaris]
MDILGLIPSFGNIIFTLAAFVIALSVIVAIHEYGHYIVGRWSGIHAEVFSIGFGPVIWSRMDKRGTRWQIAALPLGGFVKFLGDADAASAGVDKAAMAELGEDAEALRHTMHGAPLWARAATVAAGPIFNFVLSIIVFAGLALWQGQVREPLTVQQLLPHPVAEGAFEPGDEILAIEGRPFGALAEFRDVVEGLPLKPEMAYDIRRDGAGLTVTGPYPYPSHAVAVQPGSAAEAAGVLPGDVITAVDGQPVFAFEQLRSYVGDSDGSPVTLTIWRAGEELKLTMAPKRVDLPLAEGGFETRWLIGITGGLFFEPQSVGRGVISSLDYGVAQTGFIIRSSLSGLYHVITGAISSCNLSGPIGIAETSGAAASQGLNSFIFFIAVLSTAVGLLNLFPIPILDGGHLVFFAYEAVSGRAPSEKALRVMMMAGLAIMLSLMLFALSNDLFCP